MPTRLRPQGAQGRGGCRGSRCWFDAGHGCFRDWKLCHYRPHVCRLARAADCCCTQVFSCPHSRAPKLGGTGLRGHWLKGIPYHILASVDRASITISCSPVFASLSLPLFSCIASLCPCLAPITLAHVAQSIPRGHCMSISHTVGQSKHGRAGPAGCVLKGIAPRVVPIPHLGIRSRGLKSHLLLTHALPSSCSVSQACSVFFLFALAFVACSRANQAFQSRTSRVHVERHSTICGSHPTSWHPFMGPQKPSLAHSDALSHTCSIFF